MDVKIQRINAYDDVRFSEKVLKQHGAFVINDETLCEVEIIGTCEAIIRGEVEEFYNEIIDEFRFYAEHICKFYSEKNELIKTFEPMDLFQVRMEAIQPSQFYVDEDKIEAVKSFITSPEDIIIPLIKDGERYISLDGHTRLATATELGYERVWGFFAETNEYVLAFAKEAKKRGIHTPHDLKRVPHDEYEIVWNKFCVEFFENQD